MIRRSWEPPATVSKPIADVSVAMMQGYIRSARKRGIGMMHTARPFSYYRKVFYSGQSSNKVIRALQGKRVVDVGCGYTPYATDSMFRACHDANIEFFGVDPLIQKDITFSVRARILARATGGRGRFSTSAPGIERAISTTADDMPFDDSSVDEILCSYLLFVWIEDEQVLADILDEFLRVLKPGGVAKIFPQQTWRQYEFSNPRLDALLSEFDLLQTFVHGGHDWRVQPAMLTRLTRKS
ncbi:MAG: class I SAM-dependent methyltransferase [Pseudomonadota bacterium]